MFEVIVIGALLVIAVLLLLIYIKLQNIEQLVRFNHTNIWTIIGKVNSLGAD